MKDEQHIRLDISNNGMIGHVFLIDGDGKETELHNVVSADLSIDANKRRMVDPIAKLHIVLMANQVTVTAPLSVCDIDVVQKVLITVQPSKEREVR